MLKYKIICALLILVAVASYAFGAIQLTGVKYTKYKKLYSEYSQMRDEAFENSKTATDSVKDEYLAAVTKYENMADDCKNSMDEIRQKAIVFLALGTVFLIAAAVAVKKLLIA